MMEHVNLVPVDRYVAMSDKLPGLIPGIRIAQTIDSVVQSSLQKEQTDMPLLVVESTGKFLRERDLKSGGRQDVFYLWDTASGAIKEAPRKSLALNGLVPALSGRFEVGSLQGKIKVRTVMDMLSSHLYRNFTPVQASQVTGTPPELIRQLAHEIAAAKGVVSISSANWGKHFHGDLIERAMILIFALCGHMGRKGATYSAFPMMGLDTSTGLT